MEIEAKFRIPNEETFQRLWEATSLAGFSLGAGTVAQLHDRYLDTANRVVRAQGFACRLRRQGDRYLATLKSLGTSSDAVHRRAEYEVTLKGPLLPSDWPPGDTRDLALRLCGSEPLTALFEIEQVRHSRPLHEEARAVAELNLDRVGVGREGIVVATYLELEVELLPEGREQDLRKVARELEKGWGLAPESHSKFERALALFDTEPVPVEETD